jgi:hypothetical protein
MFPRKRGRDPVDHDVIVGWLLPYLNRQTN